MLFEEGISKESEFESDAFSVEAMITLGYDWKSYQSYLNKVAALIYQGDGEVVSKTHPDISERLESISSIREISHQDNIKGKTHVKRFNQYQAPQ